MVENIKKKYLVNFFSAVTIIIIASCFCLADGKSIFDVYLPNGIYSIWNDEVIYYKQIEAILEYGFPRGFYGYNESTAQLLTFGPWSIALLIPYAIWGKIFGWTYISPVLCNIFMVTIGFFIMQKLLRFQVIQIVEIYAFLFVVKNIIRYIVSGMAEPVIYMNLLIIVSLMIALQKKFNIKYFLFLIGMIGVLSIMRPYYLIMYIFPFYQILKRKQVKYLIILGIECVLVIGIYYIINKYLVAPYFFPIINMELFNELSNGLSAFGQYISNTFITKTQDIYQVIKAAFSSGNAGGRTWILFYITIFTLIVSLILQIKKKNKEMIVFVSIWVINCIIIYFAILFLYSVFSGHRHLFPLLLGSLIIIVFQNNIKIYGVYILLITLSIIGTKNEKEVFQVTYTNEKSIQYGAELEKEFESVILLQNDVGWNNTVVWVLNTPYNILYYLPKGVGINIALSDYYINMPINEIKAKYILVAPESEAELYLKSIGFKEQIRKTDFVLLSLPVSKN